ncbi:MAG: NAD(P)H-dependent oxidoreductase [Lentisphaeraceae bacterium]|nr:NAD(P)H-dependent oxidoreductase [Lentisphaeraceae bacterium]
MKIVTILGSTQKNSNTAKALKEIENHLRQQNIEVEQVNPSELILHSPGIDESSDAELLQKIVRSADGVILSTPEYHGSYSGILKIVLENLAYPSLLSGKPVALLGVAAGAPGATKAIEHLRGVTAHLECQTLPKAVSVPNAYQIFDEDGNCTDDDILHRLRSLGDSLKDCINKNKILVNSVAMA